MSHGVSVLQRFEKGSNHNFIKSYGDISKKDVERINKIVLLANSLGFEKKYTEEFYRKTSDDNVEPLFMPVKKCKSYRRKTPFEYTRYC